MVQAHIDNELSGEPTELFGLHSNAEIDFRTIISEHLENDSACLPRDEDTDSNEDAQSPQSYSSPKLRKCMRFRTRLTLIWMRLSR